MRFGVAGCSCLGRGHKRRLLSFAAVSVAAKSPPATSPLLGLLQNSLPPPVSPSQAAVGQLSSIQAWGLAEGQLSLRTSLSRERRRPGSESRAIGTVGCEDEGTSTKCLLRSARITTQFPNSALSGRGRVLAGARLRSASSAAGEGVECSPVASTQRRPDREACLSSKEMCRSRYPSQAIAETPCL